MKKTFFALLCLLTFGFVTQAQENQERPDYLNPDLPLEVRVDDIVSRMTLEEKVAQMLDGAKPVERLGIPEYNWWNECLHGVARAGIATVFPQAIGLAATFNTDLMYKIADVISTEARAKHHEAFRNNDFARYKGLTFWTPNINIFRDPRWGRGQETYGEDPYLTSQMGVSFVRGLQGNDPKYFKVVATPKHYAVHSGPEPSRHTFDAITDKRDLYTTYLPAFKACIEEGNAYSVMCAYNRYMGKACCGSDDLLKEILRKDWGFDGYIVSDCGAIADIYRNHKIVETAPEAAALAVKSGTDLNCGRVYDPALIDAVKQGLITEAEIDVSVKRLYRARFKLGMFDPPEMVPYAKIPFSENDSEEHRKMALKAAQESIVLLKNDKNALPLKKDLKKIAVIGPTADSYDMLLGNYNGIPSRYSTPLTGITKKVNSKTEVVFEQGCNLVEDGPILNPIKTDMVSFEGKPGLKMEYFKESNLEGEPFFSEVNEMGNASFIQFRRIPGMERGMKYSVRWTGKLTMPVSGDIEFTVSGDDGYRLFIDGKPVVEDWTEHEQATTKSNHIELEKGKSYDFKVEFFQSTGFPRLSVEWDIYNTDHFKNAIDLAKSSDAVIFVGGITARLEGEEMRVNYEGFNGGDRTNIKLPKIQEDLIKALHETGKPLILVLTSGSALGAVWEKENIPAIVQLWYPGQEGGTALADVLFGDCNPSGRLPVTFYQSIDQLPPFEDYNMKGKTYRFFEGEPLWAFGYGMSYTTFGYSDFKVPGKMKTGDDLTVSVKVKNTGNMAGYEVVQLYLKLTDASVPVPLKSLQGIKKVSLNPGEEKTVEFILDPQQMAVYYDDGNFMMEPGFVEVYVGGSQPGGVPATTEVLMKKLEVTGNPYLVEQ